MNTLAEPVDRLEITGRVREALSGMMEIESYAWNERGTLTLRGHLLAPAQALYRAIRTQMEGLGFTPFLRRHAGQDELVAVPGVIERTAPRRWLPLLLFLLTVLTSMMTGALYEGVDVWSNPGGIGAGIPFAATVIGILFTHEMGHYVVGRLRHAPVSLPYFIPVPPIGPLAGTGTLGAVIVQREPMEDRRTILEVGIAGPLAGLVVAVPVLLYGLATSTISVPTPEMLATGYIQEGNSLLYLAAKYAVFGMILPNNGLDVHLNSVAWGAWIGLLVTMINLLPIGQLDGGHVAYALLGDRSRLLAYVIIGLCFVLGVVLSPYWFVWGVLSLLIGARHPAPLNDVSRLTGWHIALAIFGLVVFLLLFMPVPLREVYPANPGPAAFWANRAHVGF